MNNPKRPPGPWTVDASCPTDVLAPENANLLFIVAQDTTVIDINNLTGMKEREANARLIAAAPEMLEFLQRLEKEADGDENPLAKELRALIAKATGGEK